MTTSVTNQATLTATSGWCSNSYCNSSWGDRRKITFNNTTANLGVTSEALTNFPVLVKLSSSNIDYSKTQSAGQDIRFTDSSGNDLAYEIEKWDSTATSFVWVKVPSISINSSTDYMYMYYGNSSATDHQQATSVWDSNYKAVWHMKDNPANTNVTESTSNTNTGTAQQNTSALTTTGQLNGAITFNGSSDYVTVTDNSSLTINGAITLSGWIKHNISQGGVAIFIDKTTTTSSVNGGWWVAIDYRNNSRAANTASLEFELGGSGLYKNVTARNVFPSTANWYYYTVTVASDGTVKLYVNGSQVTINNTEGTYTGAIVNKVNNIGIGAVAGGTVKYTGSLDKTTISDTVRSAAWIAASYKSETDSFNTFAAQEQYYQSSGTLISSIFDSGQGSDWGILTYAATSPTNTSVSVKVRTGNQSDLSDATAFTSCTAISSGSTVGGTTCATNNQRYVQYQLSLANTDSVSTPTFTSFSLAFTVSDTTVPSITLNSVSTPTNNSKPPVTGTATDSDDTVSSVQFQMEGTSGSWTNCTGTFGTASVSFTCTPSSALSDGAHTMYVRATDSNGNTTTNANASTATFTTDVTIPTGLSLDSPGDNSYTTSDRPSYRFRIASDATSGISKYKLDVNNGDSGSFTVDNIPTSGTADSSTSKYTIHFDSFGDSDTTDDYISVSTKSTGDWSSSNNDGKLKEGKRSWTITAYDNAGNTASAGRTIFLDQTAPTVAMTQINDTAFKDNLATNNQKPTIFGKITDPLSGDKTESKVASGSKSVDIKIEKQNFGTYDLHTLVTVNLNESYWSSDGSKITDNSQNKADKYSTFGFTPQVPLDLGTYRVTISGKDNAGNTGSSTSFNLTVTTFEKITTPEEKKIVEQGTHGLKPEQKETIKKELTITKEIQPQQPSALEKVIGVVISGGKNLISFAFDVTGKVAGGIGKGLVFAGEKVGSALTFVGGKVGQGVQITGNITGRMQAFVGKTTGSIVAFGGRAVQNGVKAVGQGLAFVGQGIQKGAQAGFNTVGQLLAFAGNKVGEGISTAVKGTGDLLASLGQGISNTGNAIGSGYSQFANNAPGVTKTILIGIGNGVSTTTSMIGNAVNSVATTTVTIAQNIASVIGQTASNIGSGTVTLAQSAASVVGNATRTITTAAGTTSQKTRSFIAGLTQKTVNNAKSGVANVVFKVGEKTQDISDSAGYSIVQFGYTFVNEPTKIADVKVVSLTSTSAKISWVTNHPANGKVNYGLDETYPLDVQSEKRLTHHEFTLTNLKPNTQYHFEVMSHNKNYVYDANRKFKTPAK